MKHVLIFILTIILIQSCKPEAAVKNDNSGHDSIERLFEDYYETGKMLQPFVATSEGDNRYNDIMFNSLSKSYRDKMAEYYSDYLERLSDYDRGKLNAMDQVSYDVLKWECEINLADMELPGHLLPVSQLGSTASFLARLASGSSIQPFETVEDYDNWLKRLTVFPEWCDTAIAHMRIGIQTGYVQPSVLIEKTIPQFSEFGHGPVEEHLFYTPILEWLGDFIQSLYS